MKVVLFKIKWWDLKAAGIGLITASSYSHAAIIPEDVAGSDQMLDASESRGNINYNKPLNEFKNKDVVVYDVPFNCTDALIRARNRIGSPYDWKGIWSWLLRAGTLGLLKLHSSENLYCFEYVLYVMSFVKELRADSEHIFDKVFCEIVDSDDLLSVLNRSACPKTYDGPAVNYKG